MFERLMIDDLVHWARDYKVGRGEEGGITHFANQPAGCRLLPVFTKVPARLV
jgi:hypothetical protein